MRFENWKRERRKRLQEEMFRHAVRISNRDLPERAWRAVFRYCLAELDKFMFHITESRAYQWNPKTELAVNQLCDYNYSCGIGLEAKVPARPGKLTREAYELFLCDRVEQEKQEAALARQNAKTEVSQMVGRLDSAEDLLSSVGWVWCEVCVEYRKVPHEPHPKEDSE